MSKRCRYCRKKALSKERFTGKPICARCWLDREREFDERSRTLAKQEYGSDEIEFDTDAKVSPSDHGAWVAAWVYVRNE